MTYRSDSDFQSKYGEILPISNSSLLKKNSNELWMRPPENWTMSDKNLIKRIANKTKKIAWIVSHCKTRSKREDYVKELQKFMDVDIMGGCGKIKCKKGKKGQPDSCSAAVDKDYKFYLGFENSMNCKEYITEKMFRRMIQDVVVVTFGSRDYHKVRIDKNHF